MPRHFKRIIRAITSYAKEQIFNILPHKPLFIQTEPTHRLLYEMVMI